MTVRGDQKPATQFERIMEVPDSASPQVASEMTQSVPARNVEQGQIQFERLSPQAAEQATQNAQPLPRTYDPTASQARPTVDVPGIGQLERISQDEAQRVREIQQMGSFERGLDRGLTSTSALLTQGLPAALADAVGAEEYANERAQDYRRMIAEAEQVPRQVARVEDIESPGDLATWMSETLGEQVPNIAGFIVSAGAGSLASGAVKLGTKKAIQSKIKNQLDERTKKNLQGKIAELGQRGTGRGGLAGGATYSMGLGAGEVYGEQVQAEGVEPHAGVSLGAGALIGGLDALPLVTVARSLGLGQAAKSKIMQSLRGMSRPKRTAAIGAMVGGQEMGTETAQEGINMAARSLVDENYTALDDEGKSRLLNAAAAGGFVGTIFGGASGALSPGRPVESADQASAAKEQAVDSSRGAQEQTTEATAETIEQAEVQSDTSGGAPDNPVRVGGFNVEADGQVRWDFEDVLGETGVARNPADSSRSESPEGVTTAGEPGGSPGGTTEGTQASQSLPTGLRNLVDRRLKLLQQENPKKADLTRIERKIDREARRQGVPNPIASGAETQVDVEQGTRAPTRDEQTDQIQQRAAASERALPTEGFTATERQRQEAETEGAQGRFDGQLGGMGVEEVQTAISDLQREFPGAPQVNVVRSTDFESRPGIAQKVRKSKGAFVEREDGTAEVYLLANNLESAEDAQRTYIHEVVAHSGLRSLMTQEELDTFLNLVRGKDESVTLEQAEERVARLAEGMFKDGKENTKLQRVVAFIRRMVRKIAPQLKMSDAEIREVLKSAATNLQRQTEPAGAYRYFSPMEAARFQPQSFGDVRQAANLVQRLLTGVNAKRQITKDAVRKRAKNLKLNERQWDALDLALRRLPDQQITWERLSSMMEELFLPMTVRKWDGRIKVNSPIAGVDIDIQTDGLLPRMTGFQVNGNQLGSYGIIRAVREFNKQSARARHQYAQIEPGVDERIREFARRAYGAETLNNGRVEWRLNWEDDLAPQPKIRIRAGDTVRLNSVADAWEGGKQGTRDLLEGLHAYGRGVGHYLRGLGKFGLTPIQLDKLMGDKVREFRDYVRLVRAWQKTKVDTIEGASNVLNKMSPGFFSSRSTKESRGRIGKALFEVSERSDQRARDLQTKDPEELDFDRARIDGEELTQILTNEFKLNQEEIGLFMEIDQQFRNVLEEMEPALKAQAAKSLLPEGLSAEEFLQRWDNNPSQRSEMISSLQDEYPNTNFETLAESLRDTEAQFRQLRDRNYFPRMRFGKYAVRLRVREDREYGEHSVKEGQIVEFHTYETHPQREKDWARLERYAKQNDLIIERSRIEEEQFALLNFPPQLKDQMLHKMDLKEKQKEELDEIFLTLAPGRSFLKHMLRRENLAGYAEDAERVFGAYMFHAASHLARTKYGQDMQNKIKELSSRAKAQGENDREIGLVNYMNEHFGYIMSPKEEFVGLRSWGFLWYLGFNVKSAVVNLTQVPLVSYPFLAARYGDAPSVRQIGKGMTDARRALLGQKKHNIAERESEMIQEMIRRGILDQSQASSIAGFLEGGSLTRVMPNTKAGRLLRDATYYGSWMFHNAEVFNRTAVALATYRLEKSRGQLDDNQIYDKVEEALDATQFEYSRWNRPKFMRGLAAPIFLFQQYIQQASFLAGGGYGSKTALRFWGVMLLAGGLTGLPFAEDALDILDWLGTNFKEIFGLEDPMVDSRQFIREQLAAFTDNPDLLMHGASRYYGLGPLHLLSAVGLPIPNVDISSSISMGNVLPGTEMLNRYGMSTSDSLAEAVKQFGGPVFQQYWGIFEAIQSNDPDTWKRAEQAMPTSAKNASEAIRQIMRGEETTRGGAQFMDYWPAPGDGITRAEAIAEAVAGGFGFGSSREARKWELVLAQKNAARYHMARRSMLMEDFAWLVDAGDQEGLADVRQKIREYNGVVPHPSLKIGSRDLNRSLDQRRRSIARKEQGLPTQKMFFPLYREVQQGFPEEFERVEVQG